MLTIYSTYTIESKTIQVNNEAFSNINVASYKAQAGPTNVIYSVLLPGLGTKRVTYGKKGTGRMISFLVSGALAYGAKVYSDQQYNLYLTSSGNESLTYYDRANMSNKIFLSSLGFAATIYVYDLCYVVGRGFKNMKKNKQINLLIPKYPPIKSQELILKN
jgi:phytoene dehydrogenase-like protein